MALRRRDSPCAGNGVTIASPPPNVLISRRLLRGASAVTAAALALPAAAGAAVAAALLRSPAAASGAGLALAWCGLAAVLAVEAAFAAWWHFYLRARLDGLPVTDGPSVLKPEREFESLLTLARVFRVAHAEVDAQEAAAAAAQEDGQLQEEVEGHGAACDPGAGIEDSQASPARRKTTVLELDLEHIRADAASQSHVNCTPVIDIQRFIQEWFCGAELCHVYRGNLQELLAYGFYYKSLPEMEALGLGDVPEQMARQLEEATGTRLQPGYNPAIRAMFHLWEPLPCSWRPLGFYAVMELLHLWTRAVMTRVLGFTACKGLPPPASVVAAVAQQGAVAAAVAEAHAKAPLALGPAAAAAVALAKAPLALGPAALAAATATQAKSPLAIGPAAAAAAAAPPPATGAEAAVAPAPGLLQRRDSSSFDSTASLSPACPDSPSRRKAVPSLLSSLLRPASADTRPPSVTVYVRRPRQPATAPSTPILFLHGVGAGLLPYLPFVDRLVRLGRTVVCPEARHVAMRLSPHIPTPNEVADDIVASLDALGIDKVVCVAHSYGTFVASCLTKRYPQRLHSLCLIDPVCMGVFLPNLVSGFVYRRPSRLDRNLAGKLLKHLMCFLSTEVHMAATFCRRFFWSDVNMWGDDLPPQTMVVLAARDELLHADEIRYMLSAHTTVKVLFHNDHLHAGFLADAPWQAAIIQELLQQEQAATEQAATEQEAAEQAAAEQAAAEQAAAEQAAEK